MREITSKQHSRKNNHHKPIAARLSNCNEFVEELPREERVIQARRCLDCSLEFCMTRYGCPLERPIPEINDLIAQERFEEAYHLMEEEGGFAEITGRVCPAPCERACVLNLGAQPVTICENELFLANLAMQNSWLKPAKRISKNGKLVSVVGSGPCGLMAAKNLNRKGYEVHVYEKEDRLGGLLAYGIPTMKLDRGALEWRLDSLSKEGVHFHTNIEVGKDVGLKELDEKSDAVLLAHGAGKPRPLGIKNEESLGLIQAIDYLKASQRSVIDAVPIPPVMDMKGKKVLVVGGGDTAQDCVATAMRQKAGEVYVAIRTPDAVKKANEKMWPRGAMGAQRDYGFEDLRQQNSSGGFLYGFVKNIIKKDGGGYHVDLCEILSDKDSHDGAIKTYEFDEIILAIGFSKIDFSDLPMNGKRSRKFFVAGDAAIGPSLVVNALAEGKRVAGRIHDFLSSAR